MIKIVECPRDPMQGIKTFIPTEKKAAYLNALLRVGFDTLDFGSFVSPKAIPQMRDTAEVLNQLDLSRSSTRLLAIVANRRGADQAAAFEEIQYLGYLFFISETFQLRNINATIEESLDRVKVIQDICLAKNKQMVVYISMGFGNPYGDPWNVETVQKWVERLNELEIRYFQLSDTIGVATPDSIAYLFSQLIPAYPDLEIGAHLHTQPHNWREKVKTAYENGCRRFDGAIKGYGGCPMAKDDLTGNMPTEHLVRFFCDEVGEELSIDREAFRAAIRMSQEIFPL
jgi:hydroxymethylglutaryl-CoA lyase